MNCFLKSFSKQTACVAGFPCLARARQFRKLLPLNSSQNTSIIALWFTEKTETDGYATSSISLQTQGNSFYAWHKKKNKQLIHSTWRRLQEVLLWLLLLTSLAQIKQHSQNAIEESWLAHSWALPIGLLGGKNRATWRKKKKKKVAYGSCGCEGR